MNEGISREEFTGWVQALRSDFQGVHQRLDVMNGQVREHGQAIAVLEDRNNRDQTARVTGVMGIITAVGTFLYSHFIAKP